MTINSVGELYFKSSQIKGIFGATELNKRRAMSKISINISTGSIQKEEMIVGIDLGTTNSLVAIIHPESKKTCGAKRT